MVYNEVVKVNGGKIMRKTFMALLCVGLALGIGGCSKPSDEIEENPTTESVIEYLSKRYDIEYDNDRSSINISLKDAEYTIMYSCDYLDLKTNIELDTDYGYYLPSLNSAFSKNDSACGYNFTNGKISKDSVCDINEEKKVKNLKKMYNDAITELKISEEDLLSVLFDMSNEYIANNKEAKDNIDNELFNEDETHDENKEKEQINDNKKEEEKSKEPVTFGAGIYIVGEDIDSGKYDITAESGRGTVYITDVMGELMGVGIENYLTKYSNARLSIGDEIEVTGTLVVTFEPK